MSMVDLRQPDSFTEFLTIPGTPVKYLLRCCFGIFLALALLPHVTHAETNDWRELRTQSFAILYVAGDETTAQNYAKFVDSIYDETSAVFGHHAATPLTLRLYPTWESYVAVNPLARGLQGIVAHADYQRHEVVVVVSQTSQQNETEIENNVRHELTHIIASDLSDNRLNVLFQEGTAQYIEHAAPELETRVKLLQRAFDTDQLMRWSDLDDRDTFYGSAEIAYPQSLSVVAYLVEKYSFAKYHDFLTASAKASGYRTALEQTYSTSADDLEQDWRAWLPSYLAGGYQRNAVTAYDLSRAKQLLGEGRYAEAASELEGAISWLQTTEQADVLAQAQALLERSAAGQRAVALANQARGALEAADYTNAAELTAQAQREYNALGDTTQDAVLQEYAARAQRGVAAQGQLAEASSLAGAFRYPQARAVADRAITDFLALGDELNAANARTLRATLDQRQSILGVLLLSLGFGGVVVSIWRRFTVREAEAW